MKMTGKIGGDFEFHTKTLMNPYLFLFISDRSCQLSKIQFWYQISLLSFSILFVRGEREDTRFRCREKK